MPDCEVPILNCETMPFFGCFFVQESEETEGCYLKYLTHTYGVQNTHTSSTVVDEVEVASTAASYTITTTETYNDPAAPECEKTITCNISGSYLSDSKFFQTDIIDEETVIVAGPFQGTIVSAVVTNMAGMPDPTWVPVGDQTEDDRPVLDGPCAPVWAIVTQTYVGTYSGETLTGSTLASTVTTYSKAQAWFGETNVDEYADPVTCEDLHTAVVAATFEASGEACYADYFCDDCAQFGSFGAVKMRYRWRIPPCHPGSWYQILWDEIFFPKSYLDWLDDAQADPDGIEVFDPNANPPPDLPVLTPKAWTWTGDALGPCPTPFDEDEYNERLEEPTRISPWSLELVPPSNGRIELRNVRVKCYRSPFGSVPQEVAIGLETYNETDVDQDLIPDDQEPIEEV